MDTVSVTVVVSVVVTEAGVSITGAGAVTVSVITTGAASGFVTGSVTVVSVTVVVSMMLTGAEDMGVGPDVLADSNEVTRSWLEKNTIVAVGPLML